MNVNVKLSLTDEERNTMYRNMTGKDVKRMVSRAEVNEFVQGCIAGMLERPCDCASLNPPAACDSCTPLCNRGHKGCAERHGDPCRGEPAPGEYLPGLGYLTPAESQERERLRGEGRCDNYIRGWLKVTRGGFRKA